MAQAKASNGIEDISPAEVAEIMESKELAGGTVLSTNTVYTDRTHEPEIEVKPAPSETHEELGNGTIVTHYGPPAGSEAEAE
jgi:hypothetical protein